MHTSEFFRSVIESLIVNKFRTALAMLGIIIGIGAVVTLMSLGDSSKLAIQQQINSLGINLLAVVSMSQTGFSQSDLTALEQANLPVKKFSPEIQSSSTIAFGRKSNTFQIVGVTNAYLSVHNVSIAEGSFFTSYSYNKSAPVIVLGPGIVTQLFGGGVNPVGQKILMQGEEYTVVGVTQTKGGSNIFSPDNMALVPLSTAENRLFGTKNFTSIAASLKNNSDATLVSAEITNILLPLHHITNPNNADFQVQTESDILKASQQVADTLNNQLISIAIISLIVGGIGIMNVMLMTVMERTSEIGLRKAVGAKKNTIIAQFLGEAIIMTLLGGIIGIVGGYMISVIIFTLTNKPYAFSSLAVILALIMSTTVGLLFGWYPAWKAANLSPVEALRYE